MRRGFTASSKSFKVFGFEPRAEAGGRSKIGVIVTRAVGKAVVRNRLRGRCKAILDAASFGAKARWYVVQCRPEAATLPFVEIKQQLLEAFARARDAASQPRRRKVK